MSAVRETYVGRMALEGLSEVVTLKAKPQR